MGFTVDKNTLNMCNNGIRILLRNKCLELGKEALYKKLFSNYPYVSWMYSDETPKDSKDYALNPYRGTLRKEEIPNWASVDSIIEFFSDEIERDYMALLKYKSDAQEKPEE